MKHICTLLLAAALPAIVLMGCSGGSGGSMNAGLNPPRPTTVSLDDVPNHGLEAMAAPFALAAGTSQTLGNVTVTCPAGGSACSVSVTETMDGAITVTSTGGVATVAYSMAYIDRTTPKPVSVGQVPDHGLMAMDDAIVIAAGETHTVGNVTFTCEVGGEDCSVAIAEAEDDTVAVTATGGVATVAYSSAYNAIANNPFSTKWQQFADGNPILALTENQVSAKFNGLSRVVTHQLEGAAYAVENGVRRKDDEIWEEPAPYPSRAEEYITHLQEGESLAPVLEHNGIALLQFTSDTRNEEPTACVVDDTGNCVTGTEEVTVYRNKSETYFALLDYSEFFANIARYCEESDVASCNDEQMSAWHHYTGSSSNGLYSFSNPTPGLVPNGSATWTGIMTGIDIRSFDPDENGFVLGEAAVHIDDLSNPDVDVLFTDIYNTSADTIHPDMHWRDLVLTNGAFNDGASRTISGAFYGPQHQEVGGVFDRDGITGAFGARREGIEPPTEHSATASAVAAAGRSQHARITPSSSGSSLSMMVLTSTLPYTSPYAWALPYHDATNTLVVGASMESTAAYDHPLVSYQGRSITATDQNHEHGLDGDWRVFDGRKDYEAGGILAIRLATNADDHETLGEPWVGYGETDQTILLDDVPDTRADHDWQGIRFATYPAPGLHGSLDGQTGTFTCDADHYCYLGQGPGKWYPTAPIVFVPADGSDAVTLPAATQSQRVSTVDHLTFGYWLHVPENISLSDPVDFGVLAGGGDPFDPHRLVALSGSATYVGAALGMYYHNVAGGQDTGSFEAEVALTADFGTSVDAGSVSGHVRNIAYEGSGSSMPTGLALEVASLSQYPADNPYGPHITGGVSSTGSRADLNGTWAAMFFGNSPFGIEQPTGIAGTFEATNANSGIVGSYGAHRN